MIAELEKQRSPILSLLQRGKELAREPNAPDFLKEDVRSALAENKCFDRSLES